MNFTGSMQVLVPVEVNLSARFTDRSGLSRFPLYVAAGVAGGFLMRPLPRHTGHLAG
jgi:hypothetical protein